MKAEELIARVEKLAEVKIVDLPIGAVYAWFPMGDQPRVFQIGEPSPLDPKYRVLALFQNQEEVRVYSFPTQAPGPNESVKPKRYTVSKSAPTVFVELMPVRTFVAEWADELLSLDASTADIHDDKLVSADVEDDPDSEEAELGAAELVPATTTPPAE